jgi:xanthine dehydrogenase YagS FAD-binding subunit
MNPFQYVRPSSEKAAIDALSKDPYAKLLAGGTNLVDLMKRGVQQHSKVVDITRLPLKSISIENGVLRIGALALNSEVAENKLVIDKYPRLSLAWKAGASAQLRNMATIGGNLMQRTRCMYFYDTALPCNKREPGSGCGALDGINRMHAIFGASEKCIAVNPSDMNVALAALEATVIVLGKKGERRIPVGDFHRLPGDRPEKDTVLEHNELIIAVELPDNSFNKNVHYLKVRDRASYAFALVSVACAMELKSGAISNIRLAMGGVAHKPWRLKETEAFLKGKKVSEAVFKEAAVIAMQGAKVYEYNAYKLKLAPNSIVEALKTASGIS